MEDEPWDELSGPNPEDMVRRAMTANNNHQGGPGVVTPDRAIPVRTPPSSGGGPPPASAFSTSNNGAMPGMPSRWAKLDPPTPEEVRDATARAVASATANVNRDYTHRVSSGASGVDLLTDGSKPGAISSPAAGDAVPLRRTSSLPIEDEDPMESFEDARQSLSSRGSSTRRSTVSTLSADEPNYDSDNSNPGNYKTPNTEADRIRQEALMMLEVADATSPYSIHRTVSGGYMASHKSFQRKKRVPTALSGLNFTGGSRRPYSDDPEFHDGPMATPDPMREDYEYGDENVVDVEAMERRSSSSRSAAADKSSSNNWSSRYSVDATLMALSGGTMRSSSSSSGSGFGTERKSARNMFASSPHEERGPNRFGSGFSFRDNGVSGSRDTNLRSQFLGQSSLPPASPRKSWQEQLEQKRRRRRLMIGAGVAALAFIIILTATLAGRDTEGWSLVSKTTVPRGAITFYVTSNVPYSPDDEDKLAEDLKTMIPETQFLVHLGNIQEAAVTKCDPKRYEDVSLLLKESPVPTFIIPGEEDWPNCPDQNEAWNAWRSNFAFFENYFDHPFEVGRQIDRNENFAFESEGVFFAGIHLVGGQLWTEEERDRRNKDNFEFIKFMFRDTAPDAKAIVIFGNASPGLPQNDAFFENLAEFLEKKGKPTIYIHANSGIGGVRDYSPFDGVDNVVALQAGAGGRNPPLRVSVGSGARPFYVS